MDRILKGKTIAKNMLLPPLLSFLCENNVLFLRVSTPPFKDGTETLKFSTNICPPM